MPFWSRKPAPAPVPAPAPAAQNPSRETHIVLGWTQWTAEVLARAVSTGIVPTPLREGRTILAITDSKGKILTKLSTGRGNTVNDYGVPPSVWTEALYDFIGRTPAYRAEHTQGTILKVSCIVEGDIKISCWRRVTFPDVPAATQVVESGASPATGPTLSTPEARPRREGLYDILDSEDVLQEGPPAPATRPQ